MAHRTEGQVGEVTASTRPGVSALRRLRRALSRRRLSGHRPNPGRVFSLIVRCAFDPESPGRITDRVGWASPPLIQRIGGITIQGDLVRGLRPPRLIVSKALCCPRGDEGREDQQQRDGATAEGEQRHSRAGFGPNPTVACGAERSLGRPSCFAGGAHRPGAGTLNNDREAGPQPTPPSLLDPSSLRSLRKSSRR
jgi:hypothetical protein